MFRRLWVLLLLWIPAGLLFAGESGEADIVDRMPTLVMQLGIIIFAARIGSIVMERFAIPGVLGELLAGVLIGPYLLGGIPLPGFPLGVFTAGTNTFPIQPELYGIAIIASIILLFLSGLETDINLFLRFSLAGSIIGIGGIVFSFFFGAWTAMFFLHLPLLDPKCMFLGVMSTATSVGITARILSDRKKMDTPEGVTILAGAVIDDVLGVVLLGVVLALSVLSRNGGTLNWAHIGLIAFKEVGIWLSVTVVGLYFANRLGGFLKGFKNRFVFSILAFGLALVIAGLFERAGLAMIIGAYVVGLTLSKTEISFAIQEAMHPLKVFFVPVFFTVMGMLVDVRAFMSTKTLIFGFAYTLTAIIAKLIGCGAPALLLRFNRIGALRVGLGMIPRGEVALIIAGIGLSYGFLNDPQYNIFGIAILMTLITTLVSPPLLNLSLKNPAKGVCDDVVIPCKETLSFRFDDRELTELLSHRILLQFQSVGFFVNRVDQDSRDYQIRRENTFFLMLHEPTSISFHADHDSILFIRRMVREAAFFLRQKVSGIMNLADLHPHDNENGKSPYDELNELLRIGQVIPDLKGETREGIVWELLTTIYPENRLPEMKAVYYSVMAREHYLSSGLVHGLAIPHTHSDLISEPKIAVGIKRAGIDFGAIDGKPSYLIALVLTPEADAEGHIRILSHLSHLARKWNTMQTVISEVDPQAIRDRLLAAII